MIRFIINTVSSLTDVNGNRYHFATVTSTKTGNYLKITSAGGESNAQYYVRKLTDADWSEIHSSNSHEKIRRFNQLNHHHKQGAKYEHELTAEDFAALEARPA